MLKQILSFLFITLFAFASVGTVFAHGEDPEEDSTAVSEEDAHNEDATADGHGGGSSLNVIATIGGVIGAVVLAGGAMMFLKQSPSLLTIAGLALIGFTGLLHAIAGAEWVDILLVLNGVGYVALGIAWVIPLQVVNRQSQIIAGALIVYTLVTIVGYFTTHDHYDYLGIISKAVEFALLLIIGLSLRPSPEKG